MLTAFEGISKKCRLRLPKIFDQFWGYEINQSSSGEFFVIVEVQDIHLGVSRFRAMMMPYICFASRLKCDI